MNKKIISVVLGTYNRLAYLKKTIATIRADLVDSSLSFEIIVVDGGSSDGTAEWLVKQRDIVTIVQHNRGVWKGKNIERRSWGYFMNLAFQAAEGKFICMLSDDCLVVPGALTNGIRFFEERLNQNENLGALAFYWRNWPVDSRYFVGRTIGRRLFVNHGLYLKNAMRAVHFVDADNFHFYHADGDLILRMNAAGYDCEISPDSYIEHYADANTQVRESNLVNQKVDWAFYLKRWSHLNAPEDSFEGGWEYKEYVDKRNTAKLFKNLYLRDKFVQFVKKVINKLFKI